MQATRQSLPHIQTIYRTDQGVYKALVVADALATPSFDGSLKVWRMEDGEEWLTFKTGIAYLTDMAFSPDSKRVATRGFEGLVRVRGRDR